jgi:thymidylate synthase (FAD)
MIQHGAPPQIARDVLNHGLKTELILTANLAEWHHILKLRCSKQAHPQMQALMKPLLLQFQTIYPDYFDDLKSYQE